MVPGLTAGDEAPERHRHGGRLRVCTQVRLRASEAPTTGFRGLTGAVPLPRTLASLQKAPDRTGS